MTRAIWVGTMTLAITVAGLVPAGKAMAAGTKEPSERTQRWEAVLFSRYQFAKESTDDRGSITSLDDDFGWGIGFNFNMNEKMQFGGDFGWNGINYDVSAATDPPGGSAIQYGGRADTGGAMFTGSFHLMPSKLTPFVTGGLGWGWFDTNIYAGSVPGCYWDPWWGYICGNYPTTFGDDAFVYKVGGGLRYDSPGTFFLKLHYNSLWADFGNTASSRADQIRIDFGSMMR